MPDAAHRILQLIKQGEGPTLEFKEVRHGLGNDVYRTVCAFLNRHGGTLLLGISDKGKIKGIPPEQSGQIKRDVASAMNNPQKINPACYLTIDEAEVEGKIVLRIYVPESSQVHRCGGRIYDRNEEGDIFRTIVYVPEGETGETMVVTPHVTPHVAPHVTPHVKKLLKILVGEMTREDLQAALKLQDRKSFRELYLEPALSAGLIEMTIPDKPKSRNQRYRLTEKGKNVLMEKTNDV